MDTYWHCANRACGETVAATANERGAETRVCVCGSAMHKREQPGVFAYLDFLREEENTEIEVRTGRE